MRGRRKNVCAHCGEPMDEYIDCLESESGRHQSEYNAHRAMQRLRRRWLTPEDERHE